MGCTITLAAAFRIVIEQANIVISIEIGELPMIVDTTAPSQGQDLRTSTESAYDATVRADIELFRSYAEKFTAGNSLLTISGLSVYAAASTLSAKRAFT